LSERLCHLLFNWHFYWYQADKSKGFCFYQSHRCQVTFLGCPVRKKMAAECVDGAKLNVLDSIPILNLGLFLNPFADNDKFRRHIPYTKLNVCVSVHRILPALMLANRRFAWLSDCAEKDKRVSGVALSEDGCQRNSRMPDFFDR